MVPMNVEEIAKAVDGRLIGDAGSESRATNTVSDSRQAGPGSVFVAIRGERVDGHHVVGVENRLDLLGLEPHAHCDDGVYGRSLPGREGCDVQRIGFAFGLRRCGRCRECRNGGHIGEAVFFHLYFIVVG